MTTNPVRWLSAALREFCRSDYQATGWWALETGLELTEFPYQATDWAAARRLIVVRQSVKRKQAPGKTLSLFADDPDIQGWRYGAFVTTLDLPMVEVWRTYRDRADCENRNKELEADFGLDAFKRREFWAACVLYSYDAAADMQDVERCCIS